MPSYPVGHHTRTKPKGMAPPSRCRPSLAAVPYLIGFTPTVMVAESRAPPTRPNRTCVVTPRLAMGDSPDPLIKSGAEDSTFLSSSTSALSGPSTRMPKETEPAGCMVRRLSWIGILDLDSASNTCVARTNPSVSFAYDLISTTGLEKPVSAARVLDCFSLKRRGAIAASSARFFCVRSADSFSNLLARSLA